MATIIAVLIAVVGWLVNHYLSIKAQEKSFINQVKNTARSEITSSLRKYIKWLEDISFEGSEMRALSTSNPAIDELIPFEKHHFSNFINLFSEKYFSPYALNVLKEYETLFPQTNSVRDYLSEKHLDIYLSLKKVASIFDSQEKITLECLEENMGKLMGKEIAAQRLIICDLIISGVGEFIPRPVL